MKHRYKYGVSAAVSTAALLSVSIGAFGQDTQPEEIIVTGSYIRGSATDAASPVDVISRDDFVATGAVLPSDIIANLGVNSGSTSNYNPAAENNNIAGKGNVNLRNLGLNSTLVLINGKRQTVAAARTRVGETFVDINEIPAVMIERVEVLKNGASATYGSDAIAGVVNFITRENFQGMEFSSQYLRTGNSNQDDLTVGGVFGWSSEDDRTRLVFGVDYLNRSDLPVLDKDLATRADNSAIFGGTVTNNLGRAFPRNLAFSQPSGNNFTDANCAAAGGFTGIPNAPQNNECRTDGRPYQVYIPETDRTNAMLHFSHKFNDRAKAYSEVLFSKSNVRVPVANAISPIGAQFLQLPVNVGGPPNFALGAFNNDGTVRANALRPMPANAPISIANGGFGNLAALDTTIGFYGPQETRRNNSETQRYVLGVKGDLPFIGDREVSYDVSGGYSRNESVNRMDGINRDRFELALNGLGGPNCTPNGVDNLRFLETTGAGALGAQFAPFAFFLTAPIDPEYATNNRGNVSLALTSTNQGVGGCQFFNPYASALTGQGPANDPALLEYLRLRNVKINDSMTELKVFDAVFTSNLWELDAGPVAAAFGLQYREDSRTSKQQPERFATNLITSVAPDGTRTLRPISNDALYGTLTNNFDASEDVKAAFLELQVPITKSLEVQLATRYEDVGLDVNFKPQSISTFGSLDNVGGSLGNELTSKIAVRWQALDSVAVRASFGQSFRAPNLGLLFEGSGYTGAAVIDPLQSAAVREGRIDPLTAYTDPAVMQASRTGPLRLGLPSPTLEPEKADSYDFGLIFTPLAGLNVTLDYYRVEFRDAIINTPFKTILAPQVDLFNQAAANPNNYVLRSDGMTPCAKGSGTTPATSCVVNPTTYMLPPSLNGGSTVPIDRIQGNLAVIRVNDINAGQITTDGLELGSSYTFSGLGGRVILGTNWTYVNKYEVAIPGSDTFDAAGHTNDNSTIRSMPDLRGDVSATWANGNQNITAVARYIGSYDDDFNNDTVDSYTTVDLSYGYSWKFSKDMDPLNLRLGIIDATDADIPRRANIGRGFDTTVFSPNGRRFFLQLQQSF